MPPVDYDSDSSESMDGDLNFNDPEDWPKRQRPPKTMGAVEQPAARFKTVYLQLAGDKYRCAIRAEATWPELKAAVEARLGLPKAVAQLSSLRGNRDGALIRTGADMEAGEYLDVTLDMRSKNAQAGAKNAILKPQGRLRDYSKDLNKSQLGELWAKNSRNNGGGSSGPEFSPKSASGMPPTNSNGFPGASSSASPGDFLRPVSAPSNRAASGGVNLHGSWLNGTNPRTMSTRVSQQGGVAFSRDPKALGKDTPSPWIQAATGISVLAPQLTNRRRNLPPPNQTGMQQLPPAALQQQMQMQRPNTAPGATSQLTATMQQQKPPLRRSMSSMRKDQCSGHKAIAAVLAAREHAPEDHREHGGDWSKLGVRTGGAPIKGKGKRPVHRPQSAPLHRNPGAAASPAAVGSGGLVRTRSGPGDPPPPVALGATAAAAAGLTAPMDPRARQQHRQMGTSGPQASMRASAAGQLADNHTGAPLNLLSGGGGNNGMDAGEWHGNHHLSPAQRKAAERYALEHRKPQWRPTRNCVHESAQFSEAYPIMSHDGPGGPSEHRSGRFESKKKVNKILTASGDVIKVVSEQYGNHWT